MILTPVTQMMNQIRRDHRNACSAQTNISNGTRLQLNRMPHRFNRNHHAHRYR